MNGLPVDSATPFGLPPCEHVFSNGQVQAQVHFLIKRPDPGGFRVKRRREIDGFAAKPYLACIVCMNTGEYVDECRFTGAVLAHQRMDFAGKQTEVHVLQRLDARERLGDADGFKNGRAGHERGRKGKLKVRRESAVKVGLAFATGFSVTAAAWYLFSTYAAAGLALPRSSGKWFPRSRCAWARF